MCFLVVSRLFSVVFAICLISTSNQIHGNAMFLISWPLCQSQQAYQLNKESNSHFLPFFKLVACDH